MALNKTLCVVRLLSALTLLALGLSFVLGANPGAAAGILSVYLTDGLMSPETGSCLIGVVMLLAAGSLFMHYRLPLFKRTAFWLLVIIALVPLLTLLSHTRYIASEGGFPVIGSGQGIIKYFALLALTLFLFCHHRISSNFLTWLNIFPVALVLFWIGGMKFVPLEAEAIVTLVENSVLMSWMYLFWDVQTTSNLIGIFDISFALLLIISVASKKRFLAWVAIVFCASVFIVTQTFLLSTPGAFDSATLLTGLSQFIIKDMWFLANLLVVVYYNQTWLLSRSHATGNAA
ncbi:DUF417 family protein [Pseudoalteromonas sp. GB56]